LSLSLLTCGGMEKRIELEKRGSKADKITDLNLDNCRSTNIVGLDDAFCRLRTLSLNNVGLTSLKGFPKLPNLEKLELSDNRISGGLNVLHGSPKLTHLTLSNNKIDNVETLEPLKELKNLRVLDLFNCRVNGVENYREKVFELVPSIKYLDGYDVNEKEAPSEDDGEEDDDDEEGDEEDVGDEEEDGDEKGDAEGDGDGEGGDEEDEEEEDEEEEVGLEYLEKEDIDEEDEGDYEPGEKEAAAEDEDDGDEDEAEGDQPAKKKKKSE